MGRQNSSSSANVSTRVTRSRALVIDLTEDNSSSSKPQQITTTPAPKKRGRKRKADQEDGDNSESIAAESKPVLTKAKGKGKAKVELTPVKELSPKKQKHAAPEEKRLSRWRAQPPQSLRDRIHRCLTQRMVVLDRERDMNSHPLEETFKIAGSTGNVYQVYITNRSTCDCPDGIKVSNFSRGLRDAVLTRSMQNGLCKHILYVYIYNTYAYSGASFSILWLTVHIE